MVTKLLRLLALTGLLFVSFQAYAQPTYTVTNIKGSCEGSSNGSIDVTVTGGSGTSFTVFVFGPPNQGPFVATLNTPITITGLSGSTTFPGKTYTVLVQDNVSSTPQPINLLAYPDALDRTIQNVVNNTNCLTSNGSIDITPTGGSGSYVYEWTETSSSFTASTQDLTGLLGGDYVLRLFDTNTNCVRTFPPITVTNPSPVVFNVTPSGPQIVCTGSNLTFNLNGSENGVTYEVYRNNVTATGISQVGNGGPLAFSIPFGSFANGDNFKIRASSGICVGDMNNVVVANITPLPTASISGTTAICAGAPATLTFTLPSSGTYNVVYTDGTSTFNANNITNGATVSVSPTANTTYSIVSVTSNATGCTSTAPSPNITGSAIITINPLPTASISGTSTICPGGSGTLTFALPAGTYNVVYTDGTTNFNATGISNGAAVNASPTTNTTYTIVSVTNTATSCTSTAPSANITGSAIITVNPLPTASISGTTAVCAGGNATLTFNLSAGTFDVVYTDGTTNFTASGISNGATVSVSPTASATYTIVSVTNTAIASCTVTAPSPNITGSAVVTVNPAPTASISGTTAICSGGNATLTFTLPATGTYNVIYTDGTTNFTLNGVSNGATVSVSPTANTTYTIVSVTNTATSCVSTAPSPNITGSAVITINALPTASISGTTTICPGGSGTLVFALPAGTYDVVYTDGTTNFNATGIANGAAVNASPTTSTTYTIVSVTNTTTGCVSTAPSPDITGSAIITVNPLPTASINGTTALCSGANATLTFTLSAGTFDVVYTDGTTNFTASGISNGATVSVTPTATATYTIVSVTNTAIASCTVTAPSPNITGSAVVTVNPSPTASISGTTALCTGANATLTFTLPATGTYNVVYTDGTTNFTLNGASNGATVSVSPTANTTYTIVSVTNVATSCVSTAPSPNITGSAVVTVNANPTADISGTATICIGGSTALTFTLPAGNYNVVFTDGTTNFNANNIASGATINVSPTANTTYTIVSVTNTATSCSTTAPNAGITGSAVITVNPAPTASISGNATFCAGGNATLTFTLPAGSYDVVYTDGTTNFNANGIANGATVSVSPTANTTYTIVSVTNTVTTCTVTAPSPNITGSAVVTVNPLPTASINGTSSICVGASTPLTFSLPPGNYDVVFTDGTTNFNANGIANGATVNVSPTANTTYTIVSVTNTITTCSVSAPSANITGSAVITVSPLPTASIAGTATICQGDNATLTFTLPAPGAFDVVYTDGTTNFTATGIANGAAISVSPSANITYTIVSVTNSGTSCSVTAPNPGITGSAVITVVPTPTANIAGTATICEGGSQTLTFTLPTTGTYDVVYTDGTTNIPLTAISNGATVSVSPTATTTYTIVSVTATGSTCTITAPNSNITGSAVVTVTPLPTASISGTTTICAGSNATLTFTLPTSGNYDVVYTDGTTNFTATGIANGASVSVSPTSNISYTIVSVTPGGTTCTVTAPSPNITGSADITVTPANTASIDGTATICAGQSTPLSLILDPGTYDVVITDGTASISLPGVSNGNFVSVSPTASVTYTIVSITNTVTGCVVTAPSPNITGSAVITVNPSPSGTMSGTTSICNGGATNIRVDFTGTGPWNYSYTNGTTTFGPFVSAFSSVNIAVNPITTTTFSLVSVADASVCPGTTNGNAVVTVNQPPQINMAVGATPSPLCSGGIADVTVANSEVGVSYQLRNDANDATIGSPVVGTGGTITLSSGVLTATTTFNVLATSGGCTPAELTNKATVNVAGAVNAGLAVAADTNPICSGGSSNIVITASENGVLYQLRNDADNSTVGAQVAGTGGSINLPTGPLTATTTFNVIATNGTCSIELTDKETINVGTAPDATLAVGVTLDPLCAGGVSDVTVSLSQSGVSYQLRNDADDSNVGSAVVGTGGLITLPTGVLNATTTFNVFATSVGCASVELTATATINVTGAIDAGLTVAAANDPICAGSGTDIQIDASEVGVDYQLRDDLNNPVGAPVAGTGAQILLPTGSLTATTTFNILADNGTCSIVMSTTPTVNVDVAPDASLAVGATLNPLCTGGSTDVTVALSQTGVSYQLRDDADDSNVGTAVVGTGGTILLPTGALSATTTYNILATSGSCAAAELTNKITINVSGAVNAGLVVGSSAANICAGSGTFVQVQASETGVSYQLRNDADDSAIGSPVSGTGVTINLPTGNLTATTTFNVVANNGSCSIELNDTETITVTPAPNLALGVSAAPGIICPNNSAAIVIANSENGISYQLRNNADNSPVGSAIGGNGGNLTLSTGPLTATTTFNVFAISGTCSAQLTATATVSVRLAGDPACGAGPSDCTNFNAIIPTIVSQPNCNDRDAGEVSFAISRADGTPTTFRVIWTLNGGTPQTKFTSGTVAFGDLNSGLYQYTVIDEGNGRTCGPVDFFLDLKTQVQILSKTVTSNVTCFGGTDGNAILSVDGSSTGEYWYRYVVRGQESAGQTFTPGAPLPGGLPADDTGFIILKVDDNAGFTCPDTVMVRVKHTYPRIQFAVAATNVTTCNGTDGAIQVTGITGGDSGTSALQVRLKRAVSFATDPSGYVVVSNFANVTDGAASFTGQPQGNYVVDVRDHLDCMQSLPIAIQAPGQVPLSSVTVTSADASCANNGQSGSIRVSISDPGIYKVAISQDQANVPEDAAFVDYNAPSLPSITFSNLASGVYYIYIKSSTTTCPTRTDAIMINGVKSLADFEVLSNCENVNLTLNNITGQQDAPFVIRVFSNSDKFFKIDSLAATSIPISATVPFVYSATQHTFLVNPGTYRFVMVQTQTTGAGSCTLVSDTIVYSVRELLGITMGQVKPSFPSPKRTGSIEVSNIGGGTRFVASNNALYYEISLTTADDIVVIDWTQVRLDPQNKFTHTFEYLPAGVYTVRVRDAAGCIKTQVVEIPFDSSIYVPNMFTPNDDNINDQFEVLNLPATGSHKLIITNRWGNEVFKSNDYRAGNFWNAEDVADGVYYYRLKVDGGGTFTGWVEIIRGSQP